jgi:hypothetical protein
MEGRMWLMGDVSAMINVRSSYSLLEGAKLMIRMSNPPRRLLMI